MDQLRSMGFSQELASQALAATGGHSVHEATEWILNSQTQTQNASPNPSSSSPSLPASIQPSLNQFFLPSRRPSNTRSPSSPSSKRPSNTRSPSSPSSKRPSNTRSPSSPSSKRPKPSLCSSPSPLSDRMRPRTLDHIVGQDHLLGPSSLLHSSLSRGLLPSLVLWGPPGSGKTSIARAIASSLPSSHPHRFLPLSATTAGVKDVRDAIDDARRNRRHHRTVLFVDEVHRFSKAQQDSFLPAIEDGSIIFIGATTENPSFHLTTPLLSRSRVLSLQPLKPHHVEALLRRAMEDAENGLAVTVRAPVSISQEAIEFLSFHCDGDARVALNALEIAATTAASLQEPGGAINIVIDDAKEALQCKHLAYDRAGDEHYNLISALHKSMRGSDPDAAIYWLARMLEGGEQPLYIARRLVRFASEDVGLADPAALGHAVSCYQACHFLGMPECDVNLAQCVAYLALAPKSVAVYKALGEVRRVVKESGGGNEGVPLHLRNAPTKLMAELGYGKDYVYPPDQPDCTSQTYLPPSLQGCKFLAWPPQ